MLLELNPSIDITRFLLKLASLLLLSLQWQISRMPCLNMPAPIFVLRKAIILALESYKLPQRARLDGEYPIREW
jgi:hypothetical protein